MPSKVSRTDRKSTRLNSSHTEIYTLSLHDALPISLGALARLHHVDLIAELARVPGPGHLHRHAVEGVPDRSEEHTSELQSHRDLHSFPTRRSSDLARRAGSPPSRRSHSRARPCTRSGTPSPACRRRCPG